MKFAIYSRKSKFTGKGDSIENQVQMCKDYISKNAFPSNTEHEFFIYEDEGFTGKNTNRPEFQRLLSDAKKKKFDILICYKLDRISRSVVDFSSTLEEIQKYDIGFISVSEQFNTTSPVGRAMLYIASVFAQLERETIAERVRDNMLELAKNGRFLGGIPPFGFKTETVTYLDENLNERTFVRLDVEEKETEIVKLIFEKYIELRSLAKLETYMLQNFITTRTGSKFSKGSLRRILLNTTYVKSSPEVVDFLKAKDINVSGTPDGIHGILTYNKLKPYVMKDGVNVRESRETSEWISAVSKHKGIIPSAVWLECQNIFEGNKDKFVISSRSHNALLTGIIKCDICHSRMKIVHGPLNPNTGERFYYYVCSLKHESKRTRCKNPNGKVRVIDSTILEIVKNISLKEEDLITDLESKINELKTDTSKADIKNNFITLIDQKNNQINNLVDKISLDPTLSDIFISKIKVLKEEVTELEKKINTESNITKELKEEIAALTFTKQLLKKCSIIDTLEDDEKKELIRGLIPLITWNGETEVIRVSPFGSTLQINKNELDEISITSTSNHTMSKKKLNNSFNDKISNEKKLCLSCDSTRSRQGYAKCIIKECRYWILWT